MLYYGRRETRRARAVWCREKESDVGVRRGRARHWRRQTADWGITTLSLNAQSAGGMWSELIRPTLLPSRGSGVITLSLAPVTRAAATPVLQTLDAPWSWFGAAATATWWNVAWLQLQVKRKTTVNRLNLAVHFCCFSNKKKSISFSCSPTVTSKNILYHNISMVIIQKTMTDSFADSCNM